MKIPERPPKVEPSALTLHSMSQVPSPTHGGRYVHWDKLRHLTPPTGLTHQDWWCLLKLRRTGLWRLLPLLDRDHKPFVIGTPEPAIELLHFVDQHLSGVKLLDDQLRSGAARDRYLTRSLMEEAITSSQLEGASTTREAAKQLLRTGRRPRNRSEQMIANNYAAMRKINSLRGRPLDEQTILDLHRILTSGAMDDPTAAGRYRVGSERVVVEDAYGEVLHEPPAADELPDRLRALCDFANGITPGFFIHPVVRAILVHFALAYDHPFADGNGRCARALFYWSMISNGYWVSEFLSISQLIRRAPIAYGRAFLYTETDDNDVTYFALYHLDLLRRSVEELNDYLARQRAEVREAERLLDEAPADSRKYRGSAAPDTVNERQILLLNHALRTPDAAYTIAGHMTSHNVVYETARQDLYDLRDRGLLIARKRGRSFHFYPAEDLENRLRSAGGLG